MDKTGITDDQLEAMLIEAGDRGNYALIHLCTLALVGPWEGWDGTGPDGEPMTRAEARSKCALALATEVGS